MSSRPLVSVEFEAGLEMLAKRSPEALRATLPFLQTQVNNDMGTVMCISPFLVGLFMASVMNIGPMRGESPNVRACAGVIVSMILAAGMYYWISSGRRRKSALELAAVKIAIAIDDRGEEIVRRVSAVTTRSLLKK